MSGTRSWPGRRFVPPALGLGLMAGLAHPLSVPAEEYVPSTSKPPALVREFRGVWVATLKNIDWPSRAGMPVEQQQGELIAILNRAAQLNLNAILLQVRPACDAFYASKLEPWSEYLTGNMGRAPAPFYDPLAFAVEQAHQRGLELHAWFNPYRARHSSSKATPSAGHVSKARPHLVKAYGAYLWLDPGEPSVEEYSRNVILDVVRRYDVDGVHIDDYFYPYPLDKDAGRAMDFPDGPSWNRYRQSGGTLAKADWRRANVDRFVEHLYQAIKMEKSWVKFGISPFGIWKSGYPASIKGLSARDEIFADSRKWLMEGWLDYLSPQLYWPIQAKQQSFPVLLRWWSEQNVKGRHLWPGINLTEPGGTKPRASSEVLEQIGLVRNRPGAEGQNLYSARALMYNTEGIASALLSSAYKAPALSPASPWLDAIAPATPTLTSSQVGENGLRFRWAPSTGNTNGGPVHRWVLQTRTAGAWNTKFLPAKTTVLSVAQQPFPEIVSVLALDRTGNASPPAVLQRAVNNKGG